MERNCCALNVLNLTKNLIMQNKVEISQHKLSNSTKTKENVDKFFDSKI